MRRHELDVFSLITGLVFVAVAAGHILDEAGDVSFDGRWVVPLVMVAIGVASLAGLVRGREATEDEVAAADGAAATPVDADGTGETPVPDRVETDER